MRILLLSAILFGFSACSSLGMGDGGTCSYKKSAQSDSGCSSCSKGGDCSCPSHGHGKTCGGGCGSN
jgi:hypothetical protein